MKKILSVCLLILFLFLLMVCLTGCGFNRELGYLMNELNELNINELNEFYDKIEEEATSENKMITATITADTEDANNQYLHNKYYDVVDKGSYTKYGYTTIIHKVLAKKNISVDSSMVAYSSDGTVIGKSTSDIKLTEGEYNYFRYSFSVDVSEATFEAKVNATNYSFLDGERKAVEMVDYNVSGNDLLVTFKQTGASMGSFAKFKLLLYSGDEIVGDEYGYFSTYAKNLNGKDSTDVAQMWAYGKDFDRVEFFYEP